MYCMTSSRRWCSKSIQQQIHPSRIHFGDTEHIADGRVGCALAALTQLFGIFVSQRFERKCTALSDLDRTCEKLGRIQLLQGVDRAQIGFSVRESLAPDFLYRGLQSDGREHGSTTPTSGAAHPVDHAILLAERGICGCDHDPHGADAPIEHGKTAE